MTEIKFERFTKVPLEKIFETVTNFQLYQTWLPGHFPSMRIISVRPNTTLVEEHRIISEKEYVVMAKHITSDSFVHETIFVGGDAKGSQIVEKYEKVPQGTKIEVSVDFRPKTFLRIPKILGKKKNAVEFENIMDKLIEIAET